MARDVMALLIDLPNTLSLFLLLLRRPNVEIKAEDRAIAVGNNQIEQQTG